MRKAIVVWLSIALTLNLFYGLAGISDKASAQTIIGDVVWINETKYLSEPLFVEGCLTMENVLLFPSGSEANISITATKGISILDSTIQAIGANSGDNPTPTTGNLDGWVYAGKLATITLTVSNPYQIIVNNSLMLAEGGDGSDARDGTTGTTSTAGTGGGYTIGGDVSGFVGSGGNASIKFDASDIIISNSEIKSIAGRGGDAGDGGDGLIFFALEDFYGAGGGGYTSGNGGNKNGGAGGSGGDVSGHVGVGGFSYVIMNGNNVKFVDTEIRSSGGWGGNAGNGGDGGNNGWGGAGGGGGGYSGGGGGGFNVGGLGGIGERSGDGGGSGSLSGMVASGGNSSIIINADYLDINYDCSLKSYAGHGGSEGEDGVSQWNAGMGGVGRYDYGGGGPANSIYDTGSWGSSGSISNTVASGGNANLSLNSNKLSISRDTVITVNGGGGRQQGSSYLYIPMGTPKPLFPLNNSYVNSTPTISWVPQHESTTDGDVNCYYFQIANDESFDSVVLDYEAQNPDLDRYSVIQSLTNEEDYYWRIQANYTGLNAGWSETIHFRVDSLLPNISINSPSNNSIISPGTVIDLDVTDAHLSNVEHSIDGETDYTLLPPYNIDTTNWSDGAHTVDVHAIDEVGNTAVETYEFTIDSISPTITLNSPANNSIIQPGTVIGLDITDEHLNFVNYSTNYGSYHNLSSPYLINTAIWDDGTYPIKVNAVDFAGNDVTKMYNYIIDGTSPTILSIIPLHNSEEIAWDTYVSIEFDESMDRNSVEGAISIYPIVEISNYSWNDDSSILTIVFSSNLTKNTTYMVNLTYDAKDIAGNPLSTKFSWSFITWQDTDDDGIPNPLDPDDDNDGVLDADDPDPLDPTITTIDDGGIGGYWWIFLIIIVAGIASALLFMRRKPEAIPELEPVLETETCQKCGFEIEKGSACPFCADEEVIVKEPEPKPKLQKEEILARIEKAYNEGKLSEGQYLKNLEKFQK